MTQLVWLITGCSSWFGEHFVRQIQSRGDLVIATARNIDKIRHLEQPGVALLQLDITSNQFILNEVVAKAIDVYGKVDVLVNNAAYIATGSWEDVGYEMLLAQFETNVFGVYKLTRALLPHLRERRTGTLVFIGSRSGWYGDPFVGPYTGSKFALEGLVESLDREISAFGIKTLLIEPGRFRTKLLSAGNLQAVKSAIPDYVEASKAFVAGLASEDMTQPGDPEKGVRLIVDLVCGDGAAEGRNVPFRLPIGTDCLVTMRLKCQETLAVLEEWDDVIRSTDY
ncbi:NAD(P)-binding protein [Xylariaceae sp. FL1272]|nr:NAD(P)-binding protein [Xylariaceae sp. FL1272]